MLLLAFHLGSFCVSASVLQDDQVDDSQTLCTIEEAVPAIHIFKE